MRTIEIKITLKVPNNTPNGVIAESELPMNELEAKFDAACLALIAKAKGLIEGVESMRVHQPKESPGSLQTEIDIIQILIADIDGFMGA